MTMTNQKITQKIEAFIVSMERLCHDIRDVSTSDYENTMPPGKVQDVKDALSVVEDKLTILHNKAAAAAFASGDADVVARSGGGSGK
jgi:hypothetical protein